MGIPRDHAGRDILSKFLILLPLRTVYFRSYHYETPCTWVFFLFEIRKNLDLRKTLNQDFFVRYSEAVLLVKCIPEESRGIFSPREPPAAPGIGISAP